MSDIESVLGKVASQDEGFVYIRPCLDVTLYWAGSAFDRSGGIVSFYRQALDVVGSDLKSFRTETMTAARPLKKDTLDLVPFWFQETTSRRDIYMLFLESGAVPDEPSDRAFALNVAPGMGFVRAILPVSYLTDSPSSFLSLALA